MLIKSFDDCDKWIEYPLSDPNSTITLTDLFHPKKDGLPVGYSLGHFTIKSGARTVRFIFKKSTDLIYVLKGKAKVEVDDKVIDLQEKQLLLIPAGAQRCILNTASMDLEYLSIAQPEFHPDDCVLLEEASITIVPPR